MNPILDDVRGTYGGLPAAIPPPRITPRIGTGGKLTLNLGVIVQPYRSEDGKTKAVTTGDVAKWLENEYGVMEVFARVHHKVIENALSGSVQGALEALFMGQRIDPFGRAMQAIQTRFKQFISSYEAERVGIPGTPTQAAKRGVNHRLKHPYASSNPRRPSFLDTGTYQNSFRAWIS